ncbi:hydroxymethylglutaryl-CoA reductase, degradative [Caldithrix abyssi]|uniref:3-hydroxy-3-methylglutaryl coenzyme A reductase n=2 Tax=Caldithrix abyssi DSM 13497 TaxID=880073 RepID=A0A1J1CD01_CALAY|nr:hydroxymethylglutaryl-CoA reductase, degradative [Caldithrix abyssi]APF20587.1 3-hydroxy-3-methylglutaryl-coenzyme A reductase /mevalonate kinase [Caldithrix abyssi DSM 13497]
MKEQKHKDKKMPSSRIANFYRLSIQERLKILRERNFISEEEYIRLKNGNHLLRSEDSDRMIENVIGVFGLPMGLGLNFKVNGKDYVVPMVVEEPSIVAAVSSAAKVVRQAGGFTAEYTGPILIGQIQIVDVKNPSAAKQAILQNKEEIINLANSLHPKMVARGGGVQDLEVRILSGASSRGDMVVVHLLVDTRDAMGANLVNSMCEGVASLIEKITGGEVFLRILSNLADRSLARAQCRIPVKLLEGKGYSGEQVRDGIILAYEFAAADPYRATTHNKGIMNGIDPVVIATGNDWRAIEAAAHAYAARNGRYTSLTRWEKAENGDLLGFIELPIRVGIVGGPLESNPTVAIALHLLNISSAAELAQVLAAVGLAQNLSAIRALATEGIQRGHMSLHARSVAMAAGATPEIFETVVERLIETNEIKVWKAREIINELAVKEEKPNAELYLAPSEQKIPTGHGKVILLGEHAVVYGAHAIAAPIPLAMQAMVSDSDEDGIHLIISRWGVEERLQKGKEYRYSIFNSLSLILHELGLEKENMKIEVFPYVPRAMGLGGSASLAVAIIRALAEKFKIKLSLEEISQLAYKSEQLVHGTASGIDNTLATYGKFLLFQKGNPPKIQELRVPQPIRIVIGLTWSESLTAKMVSRVRRAWENNKRLYNHIFKEIDQLVLEAAKAIENYDLEHLGQLMNINQGLLNALQVSGREIEELVEIARNNGALGAKLTGGGGGGAIIALCPENAEKVAKAIRNVGYRAYITDLK